MILYLATLALLLAIGGLAILWTSLGFWPMIGVFLLAWSVSIERRVVEMRKSDNTEVPDE